MGSEDRMTEQIDIVRLNEKFADLSRTDSVQEERMNTKHAETEGAMERLRADLAQRDTRLILAIAAMIALATTVLGILITSA